MKILDGQRIKENEVVLVISDKNTYIVNYNTEPKVSLKVNVEFMTAENVYVSSAFKENGKWSMFNSVDYYHNDKFVGETKNDEVLEKFRLYKNERLLNDFLELD